MQHLELFKQVHFLLVKIFFGDHSDMAMTSEGFKLFLCIVSHAFLLLMDFNRAVSITKAQWGVAMYHTSVSQWTGSELPCVMQKHDQGQDHRGEKCEYLSPHISSWRSQWCHSTLPLLFFGGEFFSGYIQDFAWVVFFRAEQFMD